MKSNLRKVELQFCCDICTAILWKGYVHLCRIQRLPVMCACMVAVKTIESHCFRKCRPIVYSRIKACQLL